MGALLKALRRFGERARKLSGARREYRDQLMANPVGARLRFASMLYLVSEDCDRGLEAVLERFYILRAHYLVTKALEADPSRFMNLSASEVVTVVEVWRKDKQDEMNLALCLSLLFTHLYHKGVPHPPTEKARLFLLLSEVQSEVGDLESARKSKEMARFYGTA